MRAVIFDFFGVIHDDPLKLWLPNVPEDVHDHVASAAHALDTGQSDFKEFLTSLAIVSGQATHAIRDAFAGANINYNTVRLLQSLQGKVKLCLLSNAHTDELLPLLDQYDLRQYFDELVISSETGLAKPDPGIFLHTLHKLGLDAREVVFIDDNSANVAAAESLGIKAIHFKNAEDLEEQLACAEL